MFDYQEVSLFTDKYTPNLAHLIPTSQNKSWNWYRLDLGVSPLKVGYSKIRKELTVKGSIPYYNQGHNASHSTESLRYTWQIIQDILNVKIFAATLTAFEFGTIVHTPQPANVILEHHVRIPTFETKAYYGKKQTLKGKEFVSPGLKVKLYDPIANYQSKRLSKANYTQLLGLNPEKHYLRIENHYMKPEYYFKGKVLLTDFFNPSFQDTCKTDLMKTYQTIQKTECLALPKNKANLSTANILLLTAQELALKYGFNEEEAFYKTLSRIPNDILPKNDRKSRRKQFRKMLRELSTDEVDIPFDLSDLLAERLKQH